MHLLFSLLLAVSIPPQHTIEAKGVLRDYSHPKHAGDFYEETLQVTIAADVDRDAMALTFGEDRFLLRGHDLFTIEGAELKPADSIGDLRRTTVAKLNPLYVMSLAGKLDVIARGDELWRVKRGRDGTIEAIETTVKHDLYGELPEVVRYEQWLDRGGFRFPARITVHEGTRMKAQLDITAIRSVMNDELVRASRADRHAIYDEDIAFRELAPHLFAIELKPSDSRVFIAEFADYLFVIEGAYNDRNVSRIAARIRERFAGKPIRYFSFSHIHGQYVGGVRTYVSGGARVVTTPTGAAVVKEIAGVDSEVVSASRTFEDATNAMTVYNVDSQHTDDYFVFYFPRTKLLLAGDLLCVRGPDKPLRGRSKHLCETIRKLGISVDRIQITWPMEGYGCISPVSFEDFAKACEVPE